MRYFFNTQNGSYHADTDGMECADVAAARGAATRYVGDILKENPDILWDDNELSVTVTNEAGLILYTVTVLHSRPFQTFAKGRLPLSHNCSWRQVRDQTPLTDFRQARGRGCGDILAPSEEGLIIGPASKFRSLRAHW